MHGLGNHTAGLEKGNVTSILKASHSILQLYTYLTGLIGILGKSLDL
jgi:hypothetical protein